MQVTQHPIEMAQPAFAGGAKDHTRSTFVLPKLWVYVGAGLLVFNTVLMIIVLALIAAVAANARPDAIMKGITPDVLAKVVTPEAISQIITPQAMGQILSNLPFALGDPKVNWPQLVADFMNKEMPSMLQEASEIMVKAQGFFGDMWDATSTTGSYASTDLADRSELLTLVSDMSNALGIGAGLVRSAATAMSERVPGGVPDTAVLPLTNVSGVFGMVFSLLGLLPVKEPGSPSVTYPLLQWGETQSDLPSLSNALATCGNVLTKVQGSEEGPVFVNVFTKPSYRSTCKAAFDYNYGYMNNFLTTSCTTITGAGSEVNCRCTSSGTLLDVLKYMFGNSFASGVTSVRNFCNTASRVILTSARG